MYIKIFKKLFPEITDSVSCKKTAFGALESKIRSEDKNLLLPTVTTASAVSPASSVVRILNVLHVMSPLSQQTKEPKKKRFAALV